MPRIDQLSEDALKFMSEYKSPRIWQIIKQIADQQDEVARGNRDEVSTGGVDPMDFCALCYEEFGFTDWCEHPEYDGAFMSCLGCGYRLGAEDE